MNASHFVKNSEHFHFIKANGTFSALICRRSGADQVMSIIRIALRLIAIFFRAR